MYSIIRFEINAWQVFEPWLNESRKRDGSILAYCFQFSTMAVEEERARKGKTRGKLSRHKKGKGKSRAKKIKKTFIDNSDLDDFQ